MPSAARFRTFAVALATSTGIGFLPATAWALGATASVPRLPTSFETPARGLAVEPKLITISQDGDAFIAGPGAHGYVGGQSKHRPPPIHWRRWTRDHAAAAGAVVQGNCTPSCAQGTFTAYRVSIKLARPATSHGQLVFTRMTLRFSGRRPSNYRRTTVLTVKYLAPSHGLPAAWGLLPN
jgi:hypothetical protein